MRSNLDKSNANPKLRHLIDGVLAHNRRSLSQAITLLEGQRPDQRIDAEYMLRMLFPKGGNSIRIGISGAPGVGKSTFIEEFGQRLIAQHTNVAVLAIDPSSPISGGSILGDRVRMEELSKSPQAFIRASPAGGMLGGTARNTREAIIACESAGYNRVIIETVGVGQNETEVASMVDLFLILQQPHTGDEIQGIKKGLLELADIVAVTKGDGDNLPFANLTRQNLENALHFARSLTGHAPSVVVVSGKTGIGIDELLSIVDHFVAQNKLTGQFAKKRKSQAYKWFESELGILLHQKFLSQPTLRAELARIENDIAEGKEIPSIGARILVDKSLANITR